MHINCMEVRMIIREEGKKPATLNSIMSSPKNSPSPPNSPTQIHYHYHYYRDEDDKKKGKKPATFGDGRRRPRFVENPRKLAQQAGEVLVKKGANKIWNYGKEKVDHRQKKKTKEEEETNTITEESEENEETGEETEEETNI
ncbi:hypothetical protein Droror1_Dr00013362 [Drosera rotundifolia]